MKKCQSPHHCTHCRTGNGSDIGDGIMVVMASWWRWCNDGGMAAMVAVAEDEDEIAEVRQEEEEPVSSLL